MAISATSGDLKANVDFHFERCSHFLIAETDDQRIENDSIHW